MTAQITDTILYEKKQCQVIKVNGEELFEPSAYGITITKSRNRFNYRGYLCHFIIIADTLILDQLSVTTNHPDAGRPVPFFRDCIVPCEGSVHYDKKQSDKRSRMKFVQVEVTEPVVNTKPSQLNGITPVNDESHDFDFIYKKLNMKIEFTGTMLVGRNYIFGLYEHEGFQAAWKFKNVTALKFREGKLIKVNDLTEEMKAKRAKVARSVKKERELSSPVIEKPMAIDMEIVKKLTTRYSPLMNAVQNPLKSKNSDITQILYAGLHVQAEQLSVILNEFVSENQGRIELTLANRDDSLWEIDEVSRCLEEKYYEVIILFANNLMGYGDVLSLIHVLKKQCQKKVIAIMGTYSNTKLLKGLLDSEVDIIYESLFPLKRFIQDFRALLGLDTVHKIEKLVIDEEKKYNKPKRSIKI